MTGSALYEGTVTHRRREPVEHRLSYPLFMTLLDLDELPRALDPHPLWSARRPAPVRIRPADHLTAPGRRPSGSAAELAARARELVRTRYPGIPAPAGPVRLLSMPRFLGVGFNPVSFLFLHDEDGDSVEAVIAEVTNTPWGERHAYVLRRESGEGPIRARVAKRLHVSPFNAMEQVYDLSVGEPGETLAITIANRQEGRTVFDAGLALRRRELSRAAMTRVLVSYPPATIAALARIYWHGLRLRLKGAPHHPKPDPAATGSGSVPSVVSAGPRVTATTPTASQLRPRGRSRSERAVRGAGAGSHRGRDDERAPLPELGGPRPAADTRRGDQGDRRTVPDRRRQRLHE